jgi:predicted ribosome-associated RNA-binding protein Tma20
LVLLSDVDGLYDGDPRDKNSKLIPTVTRLDPSIFSLVRDSVTGMSKGGMASKLEAARIATTAGENVIIANGRTPGNLGKIVAGELVGTLFVAQGQAIPAFKPRGILTLDAGARQAVEKKGKSLLAIGIVEASGSFRKGDVVALKDAEGIEFARGLTNYSFEDLLKIKGLKTEKIAAALGHCPYDEVIHRDNMALTLEGAKSKEVRTHSDDRRYDWPPLLHLRSGRLLFAPGDVSESMHLSRQTTWNGTPQLPRCQQVVPAGNCRRCYGQTHAQLASADIALFGRN